MAAALALGRQGLGLTAPNPSVGAVIVRDFGDGPRVVGAGRTANGGRPHAERIALAQAGALAEGATLYVTLEPCSHYGKTPPCADAVIEAQVGGVVIATLDPNPLVAGTGVARLEAAGIPVRSGVRAGEARRDMRGHISLMRRGRPFVTLKMAMTADGGIGAPDAGQVAISSPRSNQFTHLMRAQHDAILVGVGTVAADDPRLTCRLPGMAAWSPRKVVIDPNARMPLTASMLAGGAPVMVVVADDADAVRCDQLAQAGAHIVKVPRGKEGLNLEAALKAIGAAGVGTVMLEGGAQMAQAFVARRLVDEAHIIVSAQECDECTIRPFGPHPIATLRTHFTQTGEALVGDDRWLSFVGPCSQE